MKRYKEAILDFETARDKEREKLFSNSTLKKKAIIPFGLACCYHALGDYEKALLKYDSAIDLNHKNIEYLMNKA